MIRATFRKLLRAVTGSAPHSAPPPPRMPGVTEFTPTKSTARTRGNRYVPIPGHGPGAAARRLRARARAAK